MSNFWLDEIEKDESNFPDKPISGQIYYDEKSGKVFLFDGEKWILFIMPTVHSIIRCLKKI